ncbi:MULTISPECIES: DUF4280 domain-containing protein [Sorangium]|uniref:DUF4280 domain-containing protein n=1 Tax=Sorangium cellulosum TaxID=56 RepID=A0A4P2QHP4_SORCE|nr:MULTISPECIES: DUF4280 domain-containing protein [Sorangium]AUX29116.1 hypothetical protein SOCE836_012030 [Sorangium cellulosum]WCQ88507.1 hypothetical protein NQZ70_01185 [Sorangium sp. Soce836]
MAVQVCLGATMMCSFGAAPATFMVLPVHQTLATTPAANIGDSVPILNILPFGACTSMANPMVAAATAAAFGVLTPMPCIPVPAGPWVPGSTKVLLKGMPALDSAAKATCAWGGVIQIVNPGQTKVIDG